MRDDYFKEALEIVGDPYVLVNMIWERMQMLRRGQSPLVESPEEVPFEDIALREIIEGRITPVWGNMTVLGNIVVRENLVSREHAHDAQGDASASPFAAASWSVGAQR